MDTMNAQQFKFKQMMLHRSVQNTNDIENFYRFRLMCDFSILSRKEKREKKC